MVFCNFFEADDEGFLKRLITRLRNQKLKTVQELQQLNFRIIAVGNSFNDIDMLRAAEKGVLFRPSEFVRKDHPEIPYVMSYEELKRFIAEAVEKVEAVEACKKHRLN